MITVGYILATASGLVFLSVCIYTWHNRESSRFGSANIVDEEVGDADPSPTERVVTNIFAVIPRPAGTYSMRHL